MNRKLLLNDTFDNISFSEFGATSRNGIVPFKAPEMAFQKKTSQKMENSIPERNVNTNNVTFDDSQFFSESFCIPNGYTTVISDSEDIFADSDVDWNKSFTPNAEATIKTMIKNTIAQSEDLFLESLVKEAENLSDCSLFENININENDSFSSQVKSTAESLSSNVLTQIKVEVCDNTSSNNNKGRSVNIVSNQLKDFNKPIINSNNQSDDLVCDLNISGNDDIFENSQVVNIHTSTQEKHNSQLLEEKCDSDKDTEEILTGKQITSSALADWGFPEVILDRYASKKVVNMFEWQVNCLNCRGVLGSNKNLVYSAPTSAGKTLVAEILAIKTVLERKRKVLFILPFVSVVREKMFYFQEILGSSGIRVEGYMGSYNPPGDFKSVQFAICTIEKANSLVNKMLAEGTLSDVGKNY